MGWVIFIKIYEDEFCTIYSYSHDSDLQDGRIKINKEPCDLSDARFWFDKCVELTLSTTDNGKLFALKLAYFLYKCIKNDEPLPDRHMLACG